MGLIQIKPEDRIIFLRKFAAELIINSGEPSIIEEKIKKQIEVEKLRQKFLMPIQIRNEETHQKFQKSISTSFFQEPVYSKKTEEPQKIIIQPQKRPLFQRKPLFQRTPPPQQIPVEKLRKPISTPAEIYPVQESKFLEIKPEIQPRPDKLNLEKLDIFLKDPSIQSIECSGPGRNILLKRNGSINTTKIVLNQAEITNIINNFAQQARIPVIGGILKAAVGDLIISAVISEFVGSRFIINKCVRQ